MGEVPGTLEILQDRAAELFSISLQILDKTQQSAAERFESATLKNVLLPGIEIAGAILDGLEAGVLEHEKQRRTFPLSANQIDRMKGLSIEKLEFAFMQVEDSLTLRDLSVLAIPGAGAGIVGALGVIEFVTGPTDAERMLQDTRLGLTELRMAMSGFGLVESETFDVAQKSFALARARANRRIQENNILLPIWSENLRLNDIASDPNGTEFKVRVDREVDRGLSRVAASRQVENSLRSNFDRILDDINTATDENNRLGALTNLLNQLTNIAASSPIAQMADGGIVNGATLALIGEGGLPEAVVPLPDGRSIPVMFIGGGPGGLGELENVALASDGVAKLNGDLGGLAESSTFLGISAERLLDTFGDVITGTTDLGTALKSLARTAVGSLAGSIGKDIGGTDGDVIGAFISQAGNFLISNFLATGGVMTGGGPLPLSYYGRGGVATSPRLAVFGEGSLPEAFVPLPDGRSIPVTMAGGGFGAGPVLNAPVTFNAQVGGTTSEATQIGQLA